MGLSSLRLGVFGKVVVVSCVLLVAVGSLGWLTLRTTRSATRGADTIAQEFAERVQTDEALQLVIENSALVIRRLQTRQPSQIRKLDSELAASDEALVRAIGPALDGGNGVKAAEAAIVGRIRTAYVRSSTFHTPKTPS